MLAMGSAPFVFVNWARDSLPDYLWVAAQLHGGKERVLTTAVQLDLASTSIAEHVTQMPSEWVLDGTLSSFEQLPEPARSALLGRLDATGTYEDFVPEELAHTLALYEVHPGRG